MSYYRIKDHEVLLTVKVRVHAQCTRIQEINDDVVKIALNAAPLEGEANAELVHFISGLFKIPKKEVVIVSGLKARQKVVKLPLTESFKTWLKNE